MLDDSDFMAEKKAYAKRMVQWVTLSDISKKVITQADWYQPRETIEASFHKNNALANDEHYVFAENCPFERALLNEVEHYFTRHNSSAFLIWYNEQLVHSHYIDFQPNDVFNSMSLVKSLVGICIGIAIDRGLIQSIDDPAHMYLPEWTKDARKYITIDHLLSMQSGLHSDVVFSRYQPVLPIIPLQLGNDIRKTALSIPAVAPPEHYFVYNNYNSQLLGIILERVSGMTFAQFVEKYVWQPMNGGHAFAWTDKKGMARSFGGFFARPLDWVKLGSLFVNQGKYGQQQIVPQEWLATMTTPTNTAHKGVKNAHADYGRHIWLEAHHYGTIAGIPKFEGLFATQKLSDTSMVYFEGLRGQYVFASPEHKLVVMRMGESPRKDWDASYVINQLVNSLK